MRLGSKNKARRAVSGDAFSRFWSIDNSVSFLCHSL